MAKFHIGRNGTPALCKAQKGSCPFGGEEQHYNTKEEAQKHVETKLAQEYNVYNGNKRSDISNSPALNNTNQLSAAEEEINLSTGEIQHIYTTLTALRETGVNLNSKEGRDNKIVREKIDEIVNMIGNKKVNKAFFDNIEKEYGYFVHRELSMSYSITNNNTYAQKLLSGRKIEIKEYDRNANGKELSTTEKISYFKAGMLHTNKPHVDMKKELEEDKDYQELIKNLKEDYVFAEPDTEKEKEKAFDELDEMPMSTQDLLSGYTRHDYSQYTYLTHGYDKEVGKLTIQNLDAINNRIAVTNTSPNGEKRMMFRGMGTPKNMTQKEYLDSFTEGETIVTNKMTSTSLDMMVAKSFCGAKEDKGVIVVYYSNKGMYVEPITRYRDEEEVIVPIAQEFVVTEKVVSENGKHYIVVTDSK